MVPCDKGFRWMSDGLVQLRYESSIGYVGEFFL